MSLTNHPNVLRLRVMEKPAHSERQPSDDDSTDSPYKKPQIHRIDDPFGSLDEDSVSVAYSRVKNFCEGYNPLYDDDVLDVNGCKLLVCDYYAQFVKPVEDYEAHVDFRRRGDDRSVLERLMGVAKKPEVAYAQPPAFPYNSGHLSTTLLEEGMIDCDDIGQLALIVSNMSDVSDSFVEELKLDLNYASSLLQIKNIKK